MEMRNGKRACWPTSEQLLLLKASLLEGEQALRAWKAWRAVVDLDTIDHASYRMLPLLYRNLAKLAVQDVWMDRMKGVYRRTWYENRMLFQNMIGVLTSLQEAGIATMILKGTALILLHYEDYGIRSMGDYDILVRTEDAGRSMKLISQLGWKPVWLDLERKGLTDIAHSCDFEDAAGHRFDLHWHVMPECRTQDADDELWNGSVPVSVGAVQTRALNATNQLLHVCVHGARWDPTPPFRWVADAMTVLRSSGAAIDWNRLLRQARERHVTLPMRDTLGLLVTTFGADIPANVLTSLTNARPTFDERIEYHVRTQPLDQTGPVSAIISNYWYYSRLRNTETVIQKLAGFPGFLQEYWGLSSLWHLPFVGILRIVRRTWKFVRFSTSKSATPRFTRAEGSLEH